jgi:hypothetical protein
MSGFSVDPPTNTLGVERLFTINPEEIGKPAGAYSITLGEPQEGSSSNEYEIYMAGSGKKKLTPEEFRVVRLQNLEKAREAKKTYRKVDAEAEAKGLVPPSVRRKLERGFPIMLDEENQMRDLNIKDQLWNTHISVPLPQLLYYSPDLWYQCLSLLGGKPAKPRANDSNDGMELDAPGEVKDVVNLLRLDTSETLQNSNTGLQTTSVLVEDKQSFQFLIDGGAVVSVIPSHIIKMLGKENDITKTNKTLRFGGGEIDIPLGLIKLKLVFMKDIEVTHTFCVTGNPRTPILLGADFLRATNSVADITNDTLTFRTTLEDGTTGAKKCMGFSKLPISKWKAISMR